MKTLHVTIEPDGAIQIEARGFTGASCEAASKFLEESLGTIATRRHTSAYRQPAQQQQRRSQRLGE